MSRTVTLNNKKGSTNFLITFAVVAIIALSAAAADIGFVAFEKYKLARGAENAVIAGTHTILQDKARTEELIRKAVLKELNGLTRLDINIPEGEPVITVKIEKPLNYSFLSYLGQEAKKIQTSVTLKISGVKAVEGIKPLAIARREISFGEKIVLRNNAVNSKDGTVQFVPLELGGGYYHSNLIYGYMKEISVGAGVRMLSENVDEEVVEGLEDMMKKCTHDPACTYNNYSIQCSRILLIPVVDKISLNEGDIMKILGFSAFFMEDAGLDKQGVYIKGCFIQHTVKAGISDDVENFGLVGARVIK